VILGEASLHIRGPMGKVLLAAAAYLVVVAMLSRGPLGAIRILGPRLHQVLDLVLVAGLVVSPIIVARAVSHADLDTAGIIIVEALAVVLLRMATRTHYVRVPVPVPGGGIGTAKPQTEPPPTTAAGATGAPAARPSPEPVESGDGASPGAAKPPTTQPQVPSTAWTLGVLAARVRRRGTGSDRALGDGARRLGTALGRANRRDD
jgi:hypothetical protein